MLPVPCEAQRLLGLAAMRVECREEMAMMHSRVLGRAGARWAVAVLSRGTGCWYRWLAVRAVVGTRRLPVVRGVVRC